MVHANITRDQHDNQLALRKGGRECRIFYGVFVVSLENLLNKQPRGRWNETSLRPCYVTPRCFARLLIYFLYEVHMTEKLDFNFAGTQLFGPDIAMVSHIPHR